MYSGTFFNPSNILASIAASSGIGAANPYAAQPSQYDEYGRRIQPQVPVDLPQAQPLGQLPQPNALLDRQQAQLDQQVAASHKQGQQLAMDMAKKGQNGSAVPRVPTVGSAQDVGSPLHRFSWGLPGIDLPF